MTKQILYAKLRATVEEFGRDATSKALIVGPTSGFANTAEGLFIDAPTVSVYTLANVEFKVARFFEDAEIGDDETKAEPPIKAEQTPDIPTQVGQIAERCARISETTEHDVFLNLSPHVGIGYVCLQVYVGGWVHPVSYGPYKRRNFNKDEHLAADANRWLDKVLAEAK